MHTNFSKAPKYESQASYPYTGLDRPSALQEFETLRLQDDQHMKVVRMSALHTSCLYPQEVSLVLISVTGQVDPRAILQPEGLSQWKTLMTPSGIEPTTLRPVAQCLKKARHRVPQISNGMEIQSVVHELSHVPE
jgi:hypothetical protein